MLGLGLENLRVRVRVRVRAYTEIFSPSTFSEKGDKDTQLSEFNVNILRSIINVSTELLQLRHELSVLNGIHHPLLVADFCRSMPPLTQRVYVLVS